MTKNYNLVIVDLYNGDKFPEQFENEEFLKIVKSHLTDGGMVVFNRLYFGDKRPQTVKFGNKLKDFFPRVEWFYPEANLMFLCSV
jgi:spermidine synthase